MGRPGGRPDEKEVTKGVATVGWGSRSPVDMRKWSACFAKAAAGHDQRIERSAATPPPRLCPHRTNPLQGWRVVSHPGALRGKKSGTHYVGKLSSASRIVSWTVPLCNNVAEQNIPEWT